MKGLLRDNFYAAYANEKVFMGIMFLSGIVAAVAHPNGNILIRNYMLCCLVGSAFVALESLYKDSSCRWERYKVTLPVTRADIVKSCYAGQLFWMLVGILFAGAAFGLSMLLHGYPFDLPTDILLIAILGMGIDLFMGAFFFPMLYLCGEEKKEVLLVIGCICAGSVTGGLIMLLNFLFKPKMTSAEIILAGVIVLVCAMAAYGVSCLLSIRIFCRRDC